MLRANYNFINKNLKKGNLLYYMRMHWNFWLERHSEHRKMERREKRNKWKTKERPENTRQGKIKKTDLDSLLEESSWQATFACIEEARQRSTEVLLWIQIDEEKLEILMSTSWIVQRILSEIMLFGAWLDKEEAIREGEYLRRDKRPLLTLWTHIERKQALKLLQAFLHQAKIDNDMEARNIVQMILGYKAPLPVNPWTQKPVSSKPLSILLQPKKW